MGCAPLLSLHVFCAPVCVVWRRVVSCRRMERGGAGAGAGGRGKHARDTSLHGMLRCCELQKKDDKVPMQRDAARRSLRKRAGRVGGFPHTKQRALLSVLSLV
jgi:hypothetical protein